MTSYIQRTSFILCAAALLGVLVLLWWGKIPGTSADFLIPAILGVYVGGESAKKISAHYNARLDSDADTASVIMELEGKPGASAGAANSSSKPAASEKADSPDA